jgi:regulator of RNase E activity RraB
MDRGRDWNEYHYTFGEPDPAGGPGRRATVRFDVALATGFAPPTHQLCARLLLEPITPELPLDAFEAGLDALLAPVDCLLVGVLTYGATRELVFQVEDDGAFREREPALIAAAPAPARVLRVDGWAFFNDRVCPTEDDWRGIMDREAVDRCLAEGADPEVAHDVEHCFYGADEALSRLAADLASVGIAAVKADPRRLTVAHRQALDVEGINEVTRVLLRMSRMHGVGYDGWRLAPR